MRYETYFKDYLKIIETALDQNLPPESQYPSLIHQAMRYAVFPGGKRFRPILTLAVCEAAAGKVQEAVLPAISLELIHCYSLVHDDLPALDNDDFRRRKPSCHKTYGEAVAILAGDALLNFSYELLGKIPNPKKAVRLLLEISTAAGTCGMIGGQIADMEALHKDLNVPMLDYISSHKTGKLITASAVCGAIAAEASEAVITQMTHFGECLGLAFQSVDDLQDGDGYTGVVKPKDIIQKVRDLIAKAKKEIKSLGEKADKLHGLADYLLANIPRGKHVPVDR